MQHSLYKNAINFTIILSISFQFKTVYLKEMWNFSKWFNEDNVFTFKCITCFA